MTKRVKTILLFAAMLLILMINSTSHAATLCKGKHNYNNQVYYSGGETLEYMEDIPNGKNLPIYAYAYFSRDKYGICVCGAHSYLGREIVRKEKVRINYN